MTMLSFRVDEDDARRAQMLAERLGVDRSEFLRDALRRHLILVAGETDAQTWAEHPLDQGERALAGIADWGPAEDWSDWVDTCESGPGQNGPDDNGAEKTGAGGDHAAR